MCRHIAAGRCPRGDACDFAHDPSELVEQPNLGRTKMCPALAQSGGCSDKACTFAHSKEEVRRVVLAHRAAGTRQRRERAPRDDAADGLPDVPLCRVQRQSPPVPAAAETRSPACHAVPSQVPCGSDASTSEGSATSCSAEGDSCEEGEDLRILVRNSFIHIETTGGRDSCRARSAPPGRGEADSRR
mmetsp:Transcript_24483/g.69782  ORF Transcript_24483/g.69782 Transcript_24483/m.69782 type:complete len:187 (+) Transcript_24483:126-686(+)